MAVDDYLRILGIDVPVYGTVFDYFIDFESGAWEHWDRLTKDWLYDPKEASSTIFIESKEYVKFAYFLNLLTKQSTNVLLLGPRGCGKSSIVKHFLKTVDMKKNHVLSIQVAVFIISYTFCLCPFETLLCRFVTTQPQLIFLAHC